jgi:hypothetical protein
MLFPMPLSGSIIETETDQAQEGPSIFPVLLTQNNSLVYYSWNCPHMVEVNGAIQAYSPFTITPSNTLRLKRFGAESDTAPNPNVASSNSEIISVNGSVHGLMTGSRRQCRLR